MLSVSAISVTDTADKNKEHSAKIFEFLMKELGLTEDRWVVLLEEIVDTCFIFKKFDNLLGFPNWKLGGQNWGNSVY